MMTLTSIDIMRGHRKSTNVPLSLLRDAAATLGGADGFPGGAALATGPRAVREVDFEVAQTPPALVRE
jgi:hypothetical protein